MSFVEASLSSGEHIKGEYTLHWINHLTIFGFVFIAALPLLIQKAGLLDPMLNLVPAKAVSGVCYGMSALALLQAFIMWLKIRMTELAATNKRVIKKTGIIARDTEEMKLASIETVRLNQSTVGRVLNYGNLQVTGKGVSDVAFLNITDPTWVKQSIESIEPGATRHGD